MFLSGTVELQSDQAISSERFMTILPTPCSMKKIAQSSLRLAFTGNADQKGYVGTVQENLLPGVRLEQFESDLRKGDGNELSAKFCAVHSSSALAVNCFAPFQDSPFTHRILGKAGARKVEFEKQLKIFPDRRPANLDVWIEWDDAAVAIESKLLEYFDSKVPQFAKAYEEMAPPVSEPSWWAAYKLAQRKAREHLDRAQLLKHYFGLRKLQLTQQVPLKLTLLYIFWEPLNWTEVDICVRHREEIESFAATVAGSTVSFSWFTYNKLWQEWNSDSTLAPHARNLAARYNVALHS